MSIRLTAVIGGPETQGSAMSRSTDNSRAAVKGDTSAVNGSGTLALAGQVTVPSRMITSDQRADKSMAPMTPTNSRGAVKDATRADRAAGTPQPVDEALQPDDGPSQK